MTKKPIGKHAIVIGGSLGGLFTGIMLRSIGDHMPIPSWIPRFKSSLGQLKSRLSKQF